MTVNGLLKKDRLWLMETKIVAEQKSKDWKLPWWVSIILLGLSPFYLLLVLYQDAKEYLTKDKDDD